MPRLLFTVVSTSASLMVIDNRVTTRPKEVAASKPSRTQESGAAASDLFQALDAGYEPIQEVRTINGWLG